MDCEIYNFKGEGIQEKQCGLSIVAQEGEVYVVFTEFANGASVSNAILKLATEVYQGRLFEFSPESIKVIDHRSALDPSGFKQQMVEKHQLQISSSQEELYWVKMKWNGKEFESPRWKKLKPKEQDKLLLKLNRDPEF